jgi:outer membrane autotransporter protein
MGQNASSAVQAVSGRMEMLRAGYLSPIGGLAFGDLRPDRDGYHFESRDDFFLGLGSAQGIEGARVPGCGVWAKADEVWGDAETTDERTGYRHRGSLTTLGSDARMGEVTLGGSYGFGDGRADLADDARSDIDAKHYSGYAGWDDRIAYACAVLTYSRFAHQGYRPIVFPGIARTAIADYHSRRYTVYTEAGRRIPFAKRHEFTPLLGLEYSRYRQDAYREAGADSLDLLVEGLECDSFKASLGGSYAYRLHHEKAFEDRLVLRGRYSRETMGDDLSQTTAFAANSSRSFSMTGGKESRNEYLAGAGYALTLSDSLTFSLDHDSVFRRGSREQRLSTEVRWAF